MSSGSGIDTAVFLVTSMHGSSVIASCDMHQNQEPCTAKSSDQSQHVSCSGPCAKEEERAVQEEDQARG